MGRVGISRAHLLGRGERLERERGLDLEKVRESVREATPRGGILEPATATGTRRRGDIQLANVAAARFKIRAVGRDVAGVLCPRGPPWVSAVLV